jgi:nucleoside-diphosphate-sugar epimerase
VQLADKLILVTGASGFIGGHLAVRLAREETVRVKGLVRQTSQVEHLKDVPVKLCYGDITQIESLRHAMESVDLVYHCAALTRDWGKPEDFYHVNVQGTENVLSAAAEAGVTRFIHTSTTGVYGFDPVDGIDETYPYQESGNPYCDSKIKAEQLVYQYYRERGLPITVLRPADVYGPRSIAGTLGPLLAIKMGWMILINDGKGICNHLYVTNLVDAFLLAARSDYAIGEAYIISDGTGTPWQEFFGYYAQIVGKQSIPSISKAAAISKAAEMEAQAERTGKPPLLTRAAVAFLSRKATFKIEKARRKLGYVPQISLEEGMRLTEVWLREKGYA